VLPSAATITAPTQNADGEGGQRRESAMARRSHCRSAAVAAGPPPGASEPDAAEPADPPRAAPETGTTEPAAPEPGAA
jgi:hypothetical protein